MGKNQVNKESSVQRVISALKELKIQSQVKELPQSTRTAEEAAAAVQCQLGQIVKSLIFQTKTNYQPVLILTSGVNQVDEAHVSTIIGEDIKIASARYVREQTGFAIGGVSPFGLKKDISTYIDQDLLNFQVIWAAAGSPKAVFSVNPHKLVAATGGQVISVRKLK
jgi:prolyl-tRNA editing enzyme YbaK/EbsC (Cys-tRNA(Pro) deacylase)